MDMPCKVCEQLEEAVTNAQSPDQVDALRGLGQYALRNRALQRMEQAMEAHQKLEKHRGWCADFHSRAPF
jgi:hypothetical protein